MGAGADLYAQAMATQEARIFTNIEHQSNVSSDAIIRHVSNRPTTSPRAFQWYATKQDLIDRGFPTVDGIPTPVTFEQAKQQGFASTTDAGKRHKGYTKFYTDTYNNRSKATTGSVLDRQKIYRQITGKPTFAYHGCNENMCPQWNQHGNLISNVLRYTTAKTRNQPVETSATMFEGLPRTAYELQPKLTKPIVIPTPIPEPVFIPKIPEPEPVETRNYAGLIVGIGIIAVIIYILLRRGK